MRSGSDARRRSAALKPYLEILRLVWPLALGMVNNAVMQFVDRAYLANDSLSALEAVLPATTLAWVFVCFFQAVVGYTGVFVAQYHGAGDARGCVSSYRSGLLAAVVSALLLLPLGDWIFRLTATSPELVRMECSYYDVVLWGSFFLLAQMATNAFFTGLGRTRVVFWVNLIGNLINVALDPVLIFGWCGMPAMGIVGAALATVFAQAVQFAILAVAAQRLAAATLSATPTARTTTPPPPSCSRLLLRILRFGIPSGGYEVLNMLSFTTFVFVTGRFSNLEFAVSNVCFTINWLLFAPMLGFAIGVQTLVGQARGRRDDLAVREVLVRTLRLALGLLLVLFVLVMAFHRPLLALFTPPEVTADGPFLALGGKLLVVMSVWLFFDAVDVMLCGALKGTGDTRFVFWWTLVSSFLIWLPLVGLVFWLGGTMVQLWSTMVIYVLILCGGSWWRWRHGAWRDIGLVFEVGTVKR